MNEELLKHIEILKTIPEIKESIEKLEFGCIVRYNFGFDDIEYYKYMGCWGDIDGRQKHHFLGIELYRKTILDLDEIGKFIEIIGQVHEGHLRMFFEEKGYGIIINCQGGITVLNSIYFNIDNTKPYMEQSEYFFKKLNDWLINEFSLDIK